MDSFTTEQELRDIYYDPKWGYQGVDALYGQAREEGLRVTRKFVRDWLKTQSTYTVHKPLVRKHKFRKTFVRTLGEQVQMDLVDMGKFKHDNDNYYWILTCVELLSRYAFTYPVLRKDTENMSDVVNLMLEEFHNRFGVYPEKVQFDEGKEFYNVGVRDLLKSYGVTYFSTSSVRKAAVVERFNRTLKTRMWKYFYKNETRRWVGVLDNLTEGYSGTKHGGTGMRPDDVDKDNAREAWNGLYGHELAMFSLPKYNLGDHVRISKYKKTFAKGYEPNFTEEIFEIVGVYRGDPTVYGLRDDDGEEIIGKFYEEELSPVTRVQGGERKVERIVRKRRGKALVKWVGLDKKHNSWVSEEDVPKPVPVPRKSAPRSEKPIPAPRRKLV